MVFFLDRLTTFFNVLIKFTALLILLSGTHVANFWTLVAPARSASSGFWTSEGRFKVKNSAIKIILDSWVFDNFILAGETAAKALQILETYVLVNNNLVQN